MSAATKKSSRLQRELGLFDVYAIATGAMFSSGFFLLPGLAVAATGPSAPLAYLVAGLLIIPAMLSVAELATAMPRAGGAYYFLDRSMGPLVGTIGGLGTWLALILKTAFALVGMGAYLALYVDVAIEPIALALTGLFLGFNIGGAKETSGLQRVLVASLLAVMAAFVGVGLSQVASGLGDRGLGEQFRPFFTSGTAGFLGTVGLVFVSYAGLTKVASVAEEIQDPDRNIPLGMVLSLVTATFVYTAGVFVVVSLVPAAELRVDLTPIASAAGALDLPPSVSVLSVILVVGAAIAAFASTGNAGILAASRYPMAMARDGLVPVAFSRLGRFHTPTLSIVVTSVLVSGCILLLDVSSLAKLASAFQLLLFGMLSLGVIIMRESGITAYDPGYRSPLYPWMQLVGIVAPAWLIAEMGRLAMLFTLALITLAIGWYFAYARTHAPRSGAILHAFARIGKNRYEGLELELRSIAAEKGLRVDDPFDEVVARSEVIQIDRTADFAEVAWRVALRLANRVGVEPSQLEAGFLAGVTSGFMPVSDCIAVPHCRIPGVIRPELALVRCARGVRVGDLADVGRGGEYGSSLNAVHAMFFLVSGTESATQHLRILGHLAAHADDTIFHERWMLAQDDAALRAAVLSEERVVTVRVGRTEGTDDWADRRLEQIKLPGGCLVAVIRRGTEMIVPSGATYVRSGDHLTLIGEPDRLAALRRSS